jgi:hypothetical protein
MATQADIAVTTGTDPDLKERIASFYDQSSPLWEDIWGEHMHMGTIPSKLQKKTGVAKDPTQQHAF